MPNISYESFAWWSNYHMTVTLPEVAAIGGTDFANGDLPTGIVEVGRVHLADLEEHSPLERLGLVAPVLQGYLRHIAERIARPVFVPGVPYEPGKPFAAGMVGSAWSFAPLTGTPMAQLMCEGLSFVGSLPPAHRAKRCRIPAERLAIAGGGTRGREIVNWAEPRGLSLPTSGSFLGPTVAGAAATSTHGSRLGYGGTQDMIVGIHLVTGPDKHWWLERKGAPVLSRSGLRALARGGVVPELRRDTELFEAALVHLGAMGIVAGVAIELAPLERFSRYRVDRPLTPDMLEAMARGKFKALARELGRRETPVFYELTIDPHAPFGAHALHTLYLEGAKGRVPGAPNVDKAPIAGEAIVRMASNLFGHGPRSAAQAIAGAAAAPGGRAADPAEPLIRALLENHPSAFDFYRATGSFGPDGKLWPKQTWGELHDSDALTGGIPGSLYNASFAIDRADLPRALPALCDVVAPLSGTFIFTVRFVSKAKGTLAFTRFPETAVIEIDGLSPFICNKAAAHPDKSGQPLPPDAVMGLRGLAQVLPLGARAVRAALEAGEIAYSMHWGKLGGLDQAKVHADFGSPDDAASRLGRWTRAREILLDDFGRSIFWNPAVKTYGLVG
ncbi:FAD-binding protein [Novosphingobium huizhouense]|uniref:FAD-binding protein n=1 Tax=Novosphingobium huizhouense TaxID=2866625 RepID=UPI001CD8AFA5|nr:FAD-binding protein [Novosphingobium huizhouense]